ncbi:hypothetical protein HDU96_010730 [Phlyctochytrium bullatum]|nr:hypothetical protein HDU96_010730 [Phlyctochytrium bullatum]
MHSTLALCTGIALMLATSSVSAHYELTRPLPRGVDQAQQKNGPCGGFPNPQASRVELSSLGGSVDVQLYWDGGIEVFLGIGENPTTFPYKLGERIPVKGGEKYTIPIDYSKVPGLTVGAKVTIQTICHFSPTVDLYQCADVTVDRAALPEVPAPITRSTTVPPPPPASSTLTVAPAPSSSVTETHDHDHADHDHGSSTSSTRAASTSAAATSSNASGSSTAAATTATTSASASSALSTTASAQTSAAASTSTTAASSAAASTGGNIVTSDAAAGLPAAAANALLAVAGVAVLLA